MLIQFLARSRRTYSDSGYRLCAIANQIPAALVHYQPVTAQRLLRPEDGNWLSIRRTYDGWGYSPLDQITADNVKGLRPVWIFSTGETKFTNPRHWSTMASSSCPRRTTR